MGTFSSRILGFVRDAIMLALFSRTATDAFVVAFKLPNFFRRVLGEGSLAVSFMPVFIDRLNNRPEALGLASSVFTLLTAVTLSLTAICVVFMEPIIEFWVGDKTGYASVPGKIEQTVFLARIMFFYLFLVTTYAFFMAIANALKRFFIPALAPAAFNLCFIIMAVLPQKWSQVPGDLLAYGVIVGGVVQTLMVAVLLIKLNYLPHLTLRWRTPGVFTVLKNMVPGMIGLSVFQLLTIINVKFAARLEEGAQSYIYAADRLLELPQSLIAISLGAALLPTFSQLLTDNKKTEMLSTANQYFRVLLVLALPSAVGLYVLALPIVQVLFMRGHFDLEDALMTAQVTQIYCFLLVFSSLSKVIVPAFYALKNTWLPAVVGLVCVVIHYFVADRLVETFGLRGIVASTSLSGFLNMFLLLVSYTFLVGAIDWRGLLLSVLRLLPALLALAVVSAQLYPLLNNLLVELIFMPVSLARTLALFLTIAVSGVSYFGVAWVCGSQEVKKVLSLVRRKTQRRGR